MRINLLLFPIYVMLNRPMTLLSFNSYSGRILIIPPFTFKTIIVGMINYMINSVLILRPNRFRAFSKVMWASLVSQLVRNLPATQETRV